MVNLALNGKGTPVPRKPLTDADVIAAIRANHLQANISNPAITREHWWLARVDPGGALYGPGPYVHLPVDVRGHGDEYVVVVIRVYAPARLRRRLAREWRRE